MNETHEAVLLVSCPDREGIVAEYASYMHGHGMNITQVDQSVDAEHGDFRMRMVVESGGRGPGLATMSQELEQRSRTDSTHLRLHLSREPTGVAVLCTREPHCLQDLLQRHESGELGCEIRVVVSNHRVLQPVAEFFRIPFVNVPVEPDSKDRAEETIQAVLVEHDVDLLVLARYMQILSPGFVQDWDQRIINIHHSFLPAFAGGSPYRQAHQRGVKLVGATAHYVNAELDGGPIIAQDVIACSHRDSVKDLIRKGRDVERTTLARAVRWHVERRLLVQGNRVVVFG